MKISFQLSTKYNFCMSSFLSFPHKSCCLENCLMPHTRATQGQLLQVAICKKKKLILRNCHFLLQNPAWAVPWTMQSIVIYPINTLNIYVRPLNLSFVSHISFNITILTIILYLEWPSYDLNSIVLLLNVYECNRRR